MVMIYIDFQGGAHGNFLEFMCNKFLANVPTDGDPFNHLGAAHNKRYLSSKKFLCGHYSFNKPNKSFESSKIISIQLCNEDLLALSSISLLRAGDYNINNDELHLDTYNKFNNKDYRWVLDTILEKFFNKQIFQSYSAIKDESWPIVKNLKDFKILPDWIQKECVDVHNLRLLELSPESPNCPRDILREFFKIGFKFPDESGFIKQQQKMQYKSSNDVYVFPFSSFYSTERFVNELSNISKWSAYNFFPSTDFYDLHGKFLENQLHKNSKKQCDKILARIQAKEIFDFENLDLFQESYLTAHIENVYNIELPNNEHWFLNSSEILNQIRN
jgi:hypothetical protein